MNTHAEYRRHSYRPPEPPPATDAAASELARHRDPSLSTAPPAASRNTKGITWVRPTELASYADPLVGRSVELQAELMRRARRTPATTRRAIANRGPEVAPPPAPSNRQEGLQL